MKDEKEKNSVGNEAEVKELNIEELEHVTGGSIGNVQYTETVEISEDTKSKI